MPCNSEYLNPNNPEVELSRVLLLIRELETGKPVDTQSANWDGHMPGVYGARDLRKRADVAVADLCSRLQKVDVTKFSLEMQTWWRDHRAADAKREAEEKKKADLKALRSSALAKLTEDEIDALGLD